MATVLLSKFSVAHPQDGARARSPPQTATPAATTTTRFPISAPHSPEPDAMIAPSSKKRPYQGDPSNLPPSKRKSQEATKRHVASGKDKPSTPSIEAQPYSTTPTEQNSDELQRVKAQHKALLHGIIEALDREALEELLVEGALEYSGLMTKIIVKNSNARHKQNQEGGEDRRKPPTYQKQMGTQNLPHTPTYEPTRSGGNKSYQVRTESDSQKVQLPALDSREVAYPSTRGLPWTDAEDEILIEGRNMNLTFADMQSRLPLRTKYGAQKRHKRLVELGVIQEHWDSKNRTWVVNRVNGITPNSSTEAMLHQERDEMTLDDLLSDHEGDGKAKNQKNGTVDEERDSLSLDDLLSESGDQCSTNDDDEQQKDVRGAREKLFDSMLSDARAGISEAKILEQDLRRRLSSSLSDHDDTTITVLAGDDPTDQTSMPGKYHCPYDCEYGPWTYKHKREEHIKSKHTNRIAKLKARVTPQRTPPAPPPPVMSMPSLDTPESITAAVAANVVPKTLYCPYENCTGFGPWTYPHGRQAHIKAKHFDEPAEGRVSPVPQTFYCDVPGCKSSGPWVQHRTLKNHLLREHGIS